MEGQTTESTLDHFLSGKLRKTVLLDEIFFSSLPQFISGKDKVRFKLKNCVIDEASFVEGDANVHAFFYFRPPVDANFNLEIELKDGAVVAAGGGKWGNIGELVDYDEELKSWILNLYNGGIMRTNKKITVSPKEDGSRIELSLKKSEKDWREALSTLNSTPRKIIEDVFNMANRLVTGISNWQGKQVEPWNPVEIGKGRPTPLVSTPSAALAATPQIAKVSSSSGGSLGLKLPSIPSEGSEEAGEGVPSAGAPTLAAGPPIICPMCGVENKPGSKVCFRCMSPLE
jgi:hypothetical protein